MKRVSIIAAGFAVLVLATGTALAQPGNAPVDVPIEKQSDTGDERAPDDTPEKNDTHAMTDASDANDPAGTDANETAGAQSAGAVADVVEATQGPPMDMPDPVPGRVANIHDLIRQFIDGSLDSSLGESIKGVVGADDEQTTASQDG